MCMYCERRTDVKFGWEQPKLPYHNNMPFSSDLNGNVLENDKWDGVIHDYQTATPELILTCPGYFNGEGVGTIYIPIKYCPECGRKLGREKQDDTQYVVVSGYDLTQPEGQQCSHGTYFTKQIGRVDNKIQRRIVWS